MLSMSHNDALPRSAAPWHLLLRTPPRVFQERNPPGIESSEPVPGFLVARQGHWRYDVAIG